MALTAMLRICYRLFVGVALLVTTGWAGPRVASEYRDYRIHLSPWRPSGSVANGILVPVRINSGALLHLVLDSGASGITLNSNAARQLRLETVAETRIAGLGKGRDVVARIARADSVAIGELQFQDCLVNIVTGELTREADGVIGTRFFEAFRILLDASARELRLEAFPEQHNTGENNPEHLLFVRARVNGNEEGLFLVDTGSAVTSLASDVAWPSAMTGTTANLAGVAGAIPEAKQLAPVSLEIGGRKVVEHKPVALNLEAISRRNGIKVAGILGYSVLSRTRVTFDYREGRVELSSR